MNIFSEFFAGQAYWPIDLILWGICLFVLLFFHIKLNNFIPKIRFNDRLFFVWIPLIITPIMIGWIWLLIDGCRLLLESFIKNA